PDSQVRGYGPGRYSFNVKGGRCEACEGDGVVKIEMHFLPDVFVECDVCKGRRYNRETLDIRYRGKNIADVLDMTGAEAYAFSTRFPRSIRSSRSSTTWASAISSSARARPLSRAAKPSASSSPRSSRAGAPDARSTFSM